MKDQIQTCGNCRYFVDKGSSGNCHVNPPVIVDAMAADCLKRLRNCSDPDYESVILCSSYYPDVAHEYTACRFFEQKGGAAS